MDQQSPDSKPHWAWPHVIAVGVAMIAYIIIFRYTGDSDVFFGIAAAVAMGGGAWLAAWHYLFRRK